MRMIDADDIDYESIDSSDTTRYEYYYGTGILAVRKEDIDAMPTIELPERKVGHWIKEPWHSNHVRQCSACHVTQTVTTYKGVVNFKFCPYCGADMRGDRNGIN